MGVPHKICFIMENPIYKWMITGGTPTKGCCFFLAKDGKIDTEEMHKWSAGLLEFVDIMMRSLDETDENMAWGNTSATFWTLGQATLGGTPNPSRFWWSLIFAHVWNLFTSIKQTWCSGMF